MAFHFLNISALIKSYSVQWFVTVCFHCSWNIYKGCELVFTYLLKQVWNTCISNKEIVYCTPGGKPKQQPEYIIMCNMQLS